MIDIDNRQSKIDISKGLEESIISGIELTLKEEIVYLPVEISVILVDNEEIRKLNRECRNIDRSTDVLSFPMLDYPSKQVYKDTYLNHKFETADMDGGNLVLGDMAISLERALEQSVEYGHSFEREVCYLTVHSILHLLGYDHMEEDDKALMRSREEYVLNKMNLNR